MNKLWKKDRDGKKILDEKKNQRGTVVTVPQPTT
jgi:hypothetical protein